MKKLNLLKITLPCKSLDCILKVNRNLALEKIITDAKLDYGQVHGHGLHIVTGFSMIGSKVVMELYQIPRAGDNANRRFTGKAVAKKSVN